MGMDCPAVLLRGRPRGARGRAASTTGAPGVGPGAECVRRMGGCVVAVDLRRHDRSARRSAEPRVCRGCRAGRDLRRCRYTGRYSQWGIDRLERALPLRRRGAPPARRVRCCVPGKRAGPLVLTARILERPGNAGGARHDPRHGSREHGRIGILARGRSRCRTGARRTDRSHALPRRRACAGIRRRGLACHRSQTFADHGLAGGAWDRRRNRRMAGEPDDRDGG